MQIHQDFSVTFSDDPDVRPTVRVGDHDLSDLLIDAVGPVVERLDSGTGKPFNRVWLPIVFEGGVHDPNGKVRIVNDGEALRLDVPTDVPPSLPTSVLADALDVLNQLFSTDLCVTDTDGNCTAHGWFTFGRSECAHARARRLLNDHAEVWLP